MRDLLKKGALTVLLSTLGVWGSLALAEQHDASSDSEYTTEAQKRKGQGMAGGGMNRGEESAEMVDQPEKQREMNPMDEQPQADGEKQMHENKAMHEGMQNGQQGSGSSMKGQDR